MTVKRFDNLRIWQQARAQAHAVRDSFGCDTPSGRECGFREQIQRHAVSVMNHIAEGFERRSDRDSARCLNIAKGSNRELRGMLCLAEDRNCLATEIAREMRSFAESLGERVEALSRHLLPD